MPLRNNETSRGSTRINADFSLRGIRVNPRISAALLLLVAVTASTIGPAAAVQHVVCPDPYFTLDVPDEFEQKPAGGGIAYEFVERSSGTAITVGAQPLRITIERLDDLISRGSIASDAMKASMARIAPGATVSVDPLPVRWKGARLEEVVTFLPTGGGAMVACSVRVPLAAVGIQLNVGGDGAREREVRALLTTLLAGLDGRERWAEDARRDLAIEVGLSVAAVVFLVSIAVMSVRGRKRAAKAAA